MIRGLLALTLAAVFSGAALYVSFVEHAARHALDARGQLTQWKLSYARGAKMRASRALIGFALGLLSPGGRPGTCAGWPVPSCL